MNPILEEVKTTEKVYHTQVTGSINCVINTFYRNCGNYILFVSIISKLSIEIQVSLFGSKLRNNPIRGNYGLYGRFTCARIADLATLPIIKNSR